MRFNTESREGYFRLMTSRGISVTLWITADGPAIAVEYTVDRENVTVLVNGDKVADKHGVLIETAAAPVEPEDEEPDIDDEPPPDYGPPGSGAVITEYD